MLQLTEEEEQRAWALPPRPHSLFALVIYSWVPVVPHCFSLSPLFPLFCHRPDPSAQAQRLAGFVVGASGHIRRLCQRIHGYSPGNLQALEGLGSCTGVQDAPRDSPASPAQVSSGHLFAQNFPMSPYFSETKQKFPKASRLQPASPCARCSATGLKLTRLAHLRILYSGCSLTWTLQVFLDADFGDPT